MRFFPVASVRPACSGALATGSTQPPDWAMPATIKHIGVRHMQEQIINEQVHNIVQAINCGRKMEAIFYAAWDAYERFIREFSVAPANIKDVDTGSFVPFINYCGPPRMTEESLFLTLACLRMIFIRAGCDIQAIAQLSAPSVRQRVSNSESGRYKYVRRLKYSLPIDQAGNAA